MTTDNGIGFHRMVDIATGELRPARIAIPDGLDEGARALVGHHIAAGRIEFVDTLRDTNPDVAFIRSDTDFSEKGNPQVDVPNSTSLIVRMGDGINNAPQSLLAESGALLDHTPGNNTEFVARRNVLLLGALLDRFPATLKVEPGRFDRESTTLKPGMIEGSTVLIMGYGRIGSLTAQKLRALFGDDFRIIYTDVEDKKSSIAEYRHSDELDAALTEASIAITTVSGDNLDGPLMGPDQFVLLRQGSPGAIYVNTSRGEAVDEDAMKNFCMHQGGYVGIDVARNEKGDLSEAIKWLQDHERSVVTHHSSARNPRAEFLNGKDALGLGLRSIFDGEINPRSHDKIVLPHMQLRTPDAPVYRLTVRYADEDGVSGKIGDTVKASGGGIDREVIDRSTVKVLGDAQLAAGIIDIKVDDAAQAAQIARLVKENCRGISPILGMELRHLAQASFEYLRSH